MHQICVDVLCVRVGVVRSVLCVWRVCGVCGVCSMLLLAQHCRQHKRACTLQAPQPGPCGAAGPAFFGHAAGVGPKENFASKSTRHHDSTRLVNGHDSHVQ